MKTDKEQGRKMSKIVTLKDFGLIRLGTCIGSLGRRYIGLESRWGPFLGVHDPELNPTVVSTGYEKVISVPWDEIGIHPVIRSLLPEHISSEDAIKILADRARHDSRYYSEILPRVLHGQLNKKFRSGELGERVNSFIVPYEFPNLRGDKENIFPLPGLSQGEDYPEEHCRYAREYAIYSVILCHLSKGDWKKAVSFLRKYDSEQSGARK